jgi:hypothetical protein
MPSELYEQRKLLQNKKIDLIINMDENINYLNKNVIMNYFKNVISPKNPNEKYTIPIGQVFSIPYDIKSIILGVNQRQTALNVKGNMLHGAIRSIADYIRSIK